MCATVKRSAGLAGAAPGTFVAARPDAAAMAAARSRGSASAARSHGAPTCRAAIPTCSRIRRSRAGAKVTYVEQSFFSQQWFQEVGAGFAPQWVS